MAAPLGAMLVLAVAASSAQAAPKSIGGFVGGGAGSEVGQYFQPRDAATYEGIDGNSATDKMFVVEAQLNSHRVRRLDVDGNFELMWGKDVDASSPGTGYEVCLVETQCQAPASGSTGSGKGEFDDAMGLAVDQQDGWVYVYDRDNRRIQKFDLDGNFVLMFGKGVNVTTGGDVCTEVSGDVCGAATTGTGAGQLATTFQQVRGLAVHPVSGDVFVSDPQNRRVLQYQSDGTFLRGWGFGVDTGAAQFQVCTTASSCQAGNSAGLANGQFSNNSPLGLAVDSQGVVYATDAASGTSAQRIVRFDADLAPAEPGPPFPDASGTLLGLINPTGAGGPLLATTTPATNGLEIDLDSDGAGPDEESLLALRDPNTPSTADTVVQELDIPTEADELPADAVTMVDTHTHAPIAVNGLGVNGSTGNVYVAQSGIVGDFPACECAEGSTSIAGLMVLSGASPPIEASVEPPADATATTVELTGTIDPGFFVAYRFQISTDGAVWSDVGPRSYVGGSQPVEVSQLATGLDPSTLYRVRMVLRRVTSLTVAETLTTNEGLVLTDGAAPAVETLGSANRADTSVQLRATVDANGAATTYRFEYGPAGGAFSSHIPVPDASGGFGNTADMVVQELAGLVPNTNYHYRVVATNSSGTSTGLPVEFATSPSASAAPQLGARAYELVSPADKVGAAGVGLWGGGTLGAAVGSGDPAIVGDRFAVGSTIGSVLMDGATSYSSDWAFADRTAAGWVSHSPVTHAATRAQSFRFLFMEGASQDLSTVVWGSNGDMLRPFDEVASWPGGLRNQFVGDWQGRWELLAPTDLDQMYSFSFFTGLQAALTRSVVSSDGSTVLATTGMSQAPTQRAVLGGLAGPGDPAHPAWPDLVAGRAAYVDDVSSGVSDSFDGNGVYSNLGVCADGTLLPSQDGSGKLEDRSCPPPLPGRDARLISDRGAAAHSSLEVVGNSVENVVSRDGARAFFMSPDPIAGGLPAGGCAGTGDATLCRPQLYVRQRNVDGSVSTRWVSRAEDGLFGTQDAALTGEVRFAGASTDGDKVFFQTASPLTADDPNGAGVPAPAGGVTTGAASGSSWDLYVYDLPDGPDGNPATPDADPAGGELTRISAGPSGDADCNVVANASHGALRFASEDGSRAYFTCAAPLADVSLAGNGTITTPGGDSSTSAARNLYGYHADGGEPTWRFVARLPQGSVPSDCATAVNGHYSLLTATTSSSTVGFGTGSQSTNCVRGTADGEFITLWTPGRLTLDDPDGVTGDVYGYDAVADELSRLTAPRGGVGGSYVCNPDGGSGGPVSCHGDTGFSGDTVKLLGLATRPAIEGDRIAFFQTRSRLVPADVDDAYDVYQWRNGELSLISTGDSPGGGDVGGLGGAFFKGNSEDGRNVYLATNDRLSWQDVDGVLDIYVARVGGGIPQPPAPSVCGVLAGGCHGGGAASVGVPPTSTLKVVGDGDAKPGVRRALRVGAVGAKARRRAARRGVLSLRVRTTAAGRVSVIARGRVGKRRRVLGRAAKRAGGPGVTRVDVRLRKVARKRLRAGRRLHLTVAVRQAGARPRSITVRLARGARS